MALSRLRRLAVGATVTGVALAGTACSGPAASEVMTLKFSSLLAEASPGAEPYKDFAEYVEQESDGELKVEIHWSGSLASIDEHLSAAGSGLAEITNAPSVYFESELPVSTWAAALPAVNAQDFYFASPTVGSVAMSRLVQDAAFESEFERANVVPLGAFVTEPYVLLCAEPLGDRADLKGLKIRSGGELYSRAIQALGGQPVSLPVSETYTAIQRGVVDCTPLTIGNASDLSFYEVAPHTVWLSFTPATNLLIMNRDVYADMDDDLQQVMLGAAVTFMETQARIGIEQAAEALEDGGVATQGSVSSIPALSERFAKDQEAAMAALPNEGPQSLSAEDAARLIDMYAESSEELGALLVSSGLEVDRSADPQTQILAVPGSFDAVSKFFDAVREESQ